MPTPSKPVLGFSLLGTKRTTGRPASLTMSPGRRGFRFMAATAAAVRAILSCDGCVLCWANSAPTCRMPSGSISMAPTSGFVPAVVCHDFVFVAGQMAHNPGLGLDQRGHVPEHSAWAGIEIRKQTEFLIIEKLRPALEAAGSSLEQSLKAQIYLANIEDAPDCLDAWNQYYADIPCAVTVVPNKSFATVGGIVEINLIALTNGAARKKQVVETDIPGMATYGPCIKVGEFLLPSGLIAIGHDGHIAGRTISPGFAGLAHAGHIQAEAIYDYAEALCQAAGTTMAKLLRAQYFVADVAVFPGVAMAWSTRFGRQPHPFVCVQTPTPMPAPGTAVIADFWISTLQ